MLKMTMRKTIIIMLMIVLTVWQTALPAAADRDEHDIADLSAAESLYVREMNTGGMICERGADEIRPIGHMAKLMTALICAEEIESGRISLGEEVTVTAFDPVPSPMIWLEQGDRVTVEDLLKSITIGNANDACIVLARRLSGDEGRHIQRMNERAVSLGMKDTHFEDCCGLDRGTVSTAKDLYLLSAELVKYHCLTEYMTMWTERVKCQAAELVNNNRLVRSCKGIMGVKACTDPNGGYALITAVNKEKMTVCTVMLGAPDRDGVFTSASKILDRSFGDYRICSPEYGEDLPHEIAVSGGKKPSVGISPDIPAGALLRRGEGSRVAAEMIMPDTVSAPVYEGDVIGRIDYTLDGEKLFEIRLCAAETVGKMDISYGIYRGLCNLFNI